MRYILILLVFFASNTFSEVGVWTPRATYAWSKKSDSQALCSGSLTQSGYKACSYYGALNNAAYRCQDHPNPLYVQCATNPNPCDSPRSWDQSTTSCVCATGETYNESTNTCVPDNSGPLQCVGEQTHNEIGACVDPICTAPAFLNNETHTCQPCLPPNALLNNECINPLNCTSLQQYNPQTNHCDQAGCNSTPLVGDVYDDFGQCACAKGTVQVQQGVSGAGECKPQQTCTSSSPTYLGDFNGVPSCSLDSYGNPGDDCGIVNGKVVCVADNPCTYDSLLLGGCDNESPNPNPKDVDGDGDLDGGNEGISPNSPGVSPTPLSNSGTQSASMSTTHTVNSDGTTSDSETATTVDYSPITTRQDQQTEQLTKLLAANLASNEKADTAITQLTTIVEFLDVTNIPAATFSTDSTTQVNATFDTRASTLSAHTSSDIANPDSVGSPSSLFNLENMSGQSCESLTVTVPHTNASYHFDCDRIEPFRDIIAWVLYVLTFIAIYEIAIATRGK